MPNATLNVKKLNIVAQKNFNEFLMMNGVDDINVVNLYYQLNSGKTKYNYYDILYFAIHSLHVGLQGDNIKEGKIYKLLSIIRDIASYDRENIVLDPLITSEFALIPEEIFNYFKKNNSGDLQSIIDDVVAIGTNLGVSPAEMHSVNDKEAVASTDDIVNAKEKAQRLVELSERVSSLESENRSLQSRVEYLLKELDKANKDKNTMMSKKDADIKAKLLTISELNQEISNLREELSSNKGSITNLDSTIVGLNMTIKKKESIIESLEEDVRKLRKSLGEAEDKYSAIIKAPAYVIGKETIRDNLLDDMVLKILLNGIKSAEQIHEEVFKVDSGYTIHDIYASLKRIGLTYYITNENNVSIPRMYGIQRKPIGEPKTVYLPSDKSVKKLIFISDLHVNPRDYQENLFDRMGAIYNYASDNGIDTIINLGDFFDTEGDSLGNATSPVDIFDKICYLSDYLEKGGVFDPEFNNLLLGGNHDVTLLNKGVDPLAIMEERLPGVTSIGYNNAKLKVGGSNIIGLHHLGAPRQELYTPMEYTKEIASFLKKYYHVSTLDKKESMLDLFGHVHSTMIDPVTGFAIVPSLTRDRFNDGLMEVDMYFDSKGDVEYLVINNLICNDRRQVRKVSEVPMQR